MSALAAEQIKLDQALNRQRVLLAALKEVERDIGAIEAKRTARERERAMVSAVARREFPDVAPQKLSRLAENGRRYAWDAFNRRQQYPRGKLAAEGMARLRLYEIELIFHSRYGYELPDDDAGRDDLQIAAHHIVHLGPDAERHIVAWASVWAPWASADEVRRLAARAIAEPVKFSASTLAWRLGLKWEERSRLKITTIRAIDMDNEQWAAERARKRREAAKARRRRNGKLSRAEYLAGCAARPRPWVALGISRATWYRHGKPEVTGGSSSRREGCGRICAAKGGAGAIEPRNSVTKSSETFSRTDQVSSETMDSRLPVSPARSGPASSFASRARALPSHSSAVSSRAEAGEDDRLAAPLGGCFTPMGVIAKSSAKPSHNLPKPPATLAQPSQTLANPRELSQPSQWLERYLKRHWSNAKRRHARAALRLRWAEMDEDA